MTLSTSNGAIFSPPRLIRSSTRPTIRTVPSSACRAMSPVRSQGPSNRARVAASSFQYPTMAVGVST